jgi:Protein of unknown function (DUF2971)
MNLYHYCSNRSFLSIIETREILASELSLSNDLLEGRWIRNIFLEYCNEKNVSSYDQQDLLRHLDSLIAFSGGAGFCMSADGDLLSQWRGYADDGAGVSIGFSKEYLETLGERKRDRGDKFNAALTQIEYNKARQKELVAEQMDQILELLKVGAMRIPTLLTPETEEETARRKENFSKIMLQFFLLFFHLYSIKNPAFAEEREWRIISHLVRRRSRGADSDLSAMDFRADTDRIIPFRRIPLEDLGRPAITGIILGPKNITPSEIVDAFLKKHGWTNVAVQQSKASYR